MFRSALLGLTAISLTTLSVSPGNAVTIPPMASVSTAIGNVVEVRDGRGGGSRILRRNGGGGNWNRYGGGSRYGGNWNRHGGSHHGGHHGGHHNGWDNDWWPGLAGVGIGFGLGFLNNAPYYNQPVYRSGGSAHVVWCEQRYRSYDVRSDTFQPYNGPRRLCNSPYR
jgi:BA14K-like protein